MTGMDVAKSAIEMAEAEESARPRGIEYYVGSVCNLSMFRDEMFDAVVSNIVLSGLQDLDKAVAEVHRVLKTGGRFVFSIMHPCFTTPPVHGWVKSPLDSDRAEDWLYWKVDRYFERAVEEWQMGELPALYSFHRPLSDYLKTLMKEGFILTDFEEPLPGMKDVEEHHRQLSDCRRIAWFLVMGAIKATPYIQ